MITNHKKDLSTMALIAGIVLIFCAIIGIGIYTFTPSVETIESKLSIQKTDVIVELPEEYPALTTGDTLYVIKKKVMGKDIIELGFKPIRYDKAR